MRKTKTPRRPGPSRDELAIRWFTPRGRVVRAELLDDLRHHDGEHLAEILADLRRGAVADDALDLRGVDLRGEDLAGSPLQGADLAGCKLDGANLMRANLSGARLDFGSLVNVDLRGAILEGTRLRYANLSHADLREANLENAQVDGCVFQGANLHRAWARDLDFERADMHGVDVSTVRRAVFQRKDTARRRNPLGAPPRSEPQAPATRRLSFAPRRSAPTVRLRAPAPLAQTRGFEEALAELLLSRDRVGRIVVTLDGSEVVLFDAAERARDAA